MAGDDRPRSSYFDQPYKPFRDDPSLNLDENEVTGPFPGFNPTFATVRYVGTAIQRIDSHGSEYHMSQERIVFNGSAATALRIEYAWTARNNRKGRHALIIHETRSEGPPRKRQREWQLTGSRAVWKNLCNMFTTFPWYNISWVNAITFVLGCLVLTVNGFLSFLPHVASRNDSPPGIAYIQASLTIAGSMLFVSASFLSFIEAVNAQRDGCFGWKVQSIAYANESDGTIARGTMTSLSPDGDACEHYHSDKSRLFGHSERSADDEDVERAMKRATRPPSPDQVWRWMPTIQEFRRHFLYEIGFMSNVVLLASSSLYCASSFASLGTTGAMGHIPRWIRLPQLLGATGFITGSLVLMAENQTFWLRPNPRALGWYINLFIAAGSVGLLLCAIFGLSQPSHTSNYQFSVSYFWSSWVLLIGSVLQWYESIDSHPVRRRAAEG